MHTLEFLYTFGIFEFYTIICSHSYYTQGLRDFETFGGGFSNWSKSKNFCVKIFDQWAAAKIASNCVAWAAWFQYTDTNNNYHVRFQKSLPFEFIAHFNSHIQKMYIFLVPPSKPSHFCHLLSGLQLDYSTVCCRNNRRENIKKRW